MNHLRTLRLSLVVTVLMGTGGCPIMSDLQSLTEQREAERLEAERQAEEERQRAVTERQRKVEEVIIDIMQAQEYFRQIQFVDYDGDLNGDYGTLAQLLDPDGGGLLPPLIPEELNTGNFEGYEFNESIIYGSIDSFPAYSVSAVSISKSLGARSYYFDNSGTVRYSTDETATAESPNLVWPDSDSDGVPDRVEESIYGTNANNVNTDGDRWDDGHEVRYGMDPTDPITNDDIALAALRQIYEAQLQFRASYFRDTNGDGVGDFGTLQQLYNPTGDRNTTPLIDPNLRFGSIGRYRILVNASPDSFSVSAQRLSRIDALTTTEHNYYLDETGNVRISPWWVDSPGPDDLILYAIIDEVELDEDLVSPILRNQAIAERNIIEIIRAQHEFQRGAFYDGDSDGLGDYGTFEQLETYIGYGLIQGLTDATIMTGTTDGYMYTLTIVEGNVFSVIGFPSAPDYSLFVEPAEPGVSGIRTYHADPTGVVRFSDDSEASYESSVIPWLDSDLDLIADQVEITAFGTDPFNTDTDGDDWSDYLEIGRAMDPRDPVTNDDRIVEAILLIYEAEIDFQAAAYIDNDNNGIGDYGTIAELCDPAGDGSIPSLIPEHLCDQIAWGFTLVTSVTFGSGTNVPLFTLSADPIIQGRSAWYNYFIDRSGIVRVETGGFPAHSGSIPLEELYWNKRW